MRFIRSKEEKLAIVACKLRSNLPSRELSEQFGVGSRTIRKFIKNARNGVTNHDRDGRPRCLDRDSQNCLEQWIMSLAREMQLLDVGELTRKIKEEAYNTYSRRHPNFINTDRRRKNFLSYRSLKTYCANFKVFHENAN